MTESGPREDELKELVARGFQAECSYVNPWAFKKVLAAFRDGDELAVWVWKSYPDGRIRVDISSAPYEQTALVAASMELEKLLPTVDGLIRVISAAPREGDL